MTAISNIHIGLPAWQYTWIYFPGDRVSNAGNAYQCTVGGRAAASGGPSGTTGNIVDGTVIWKWLSAIDHASLADWALSIPATLTQPVVGLLWDNGPITTTPGVSFLSLHGHTTSQSNTITLTCAPGESVRDALAVQTRPLAFTDTGVRFVMPTSGRSGINMVNIRDGDVILDGLQFLDPNPSSAATLVGCETGANSLIIRNCIFDGYAQDNGDSMIGTGAATGPFTLANCLIIDRQPADGDAAAVVLPTGATACAVVNCTMVSPNANTGYGLAIAGNSIAGTTTTLRNCAFPGYFSPLSDTGLGTSTFDHCAFSWPSFALASSWTDTGKSLYSVDFSTVFVDPAADFRLQTGSALIAAGAVGSSAIPAADDIAGTPREANPPPKYMVTTTVPIAATGAGSFTAPTGVTSLVVECFGGGAGGAFGSGASGSGAGGYVKKTVATTPGTVYSRYVGTGGSGGNSSNTWGTAGEATWFGSTSTIYAPGGGIASSSSAGGLGGTTGAIGDVIAAGGNGSRNVGNSGGGGGGAGGPLGAGAHASAATANNGGGGGGNGGGSTGADATNTAGGTGGANQAGIGGGIGGTAATPDGGAGSAGGGGGGGYANTGATAGRGGAGGAGKRTGR